MTRIEKELIKFYLDWVNNFLTMSAMSDHYNLPYDVVGDCISNGRQLHEHNVERSKATRPEYQDQYTNLD